MNDKGHPPSLRAAQPGNRNAVRRAASTRLAFARSARTEIRAAADGVSTLELVTTAVRNEVARLETLCEALGRDIALFGPSTGAGDPRGQLAQLSSVSRQLEKLEFTWATAVLTDEPGLDGRVAADPTAGTLREELVSFLALRALLDLDLEHRGVSNRRGGERRQVALRVRVSRDLVRLADRIRTEARRARSAVGAMTAWEIAREIAFDRSQRPGDVITAVKHLLTHRAPPLEPPMKEQDDEPMSDEESEAFRRELVAEVRERKALRGSNRRRLPALPTSRRSTHGETEVTYGASRSFSESAMGAIRAPLRRTGWTPWNSGNATSRLPMRKRRGGRRRLTRRRCG